MNTKLMLAGKLTDISRLRYPLYASPKLDGIRAYTEENVTYSRNCKPIPNQFVQKLLIALPFFDGELICGDPTAPDCFNKTQSLVMSNSDAPFAFSFWIFDMVLSSYSFAQRLKIVSQALKELSRTNRNVSLYLRCVPHLILKNEKELLEFEAKCVAAGYEGIMLRDPAGPYKFGRSTEREGYLLKMKRFEDSEAKILNFKERMHNANELEYDVLQRAKRSSRKAGLVGTKTLGAFVVKDCVTGVEFEIGSGFTDAQRFDFWKKRSNFIGRTITYTFQPAGVKEKPRFPVFKGLRSD